MPPKDCCHWKAGVVSEGKTETTKLHDAVLLLASRAVQLTVVRPAGKVDPEGGVQVITGAGSQRLVEVRLKVTIFEHWPGEAKAETLVGQSR